MVFYDFIEDFVEEIYENIEDYDGVAVFAAPEYAIPFLEDFLKYGNSEIQYIDYDEEYDDTPYLLEFSAEDGKVSLSIQPAFGSSGVYYGPAGEMILIQAELEVEKIIDDILNNECSRDDVEFDLFTFEDEDSFDLIDCDRCPERFDCPDAVCKDDEDDQVSVRNNGVTVVTNSAGEIRGFTKMNSYTDENDVHTSYSHSFFSDDVKAIKNAAKELGIEL